MTRTVSASASAPLHLRPGRRLTGRSPGNRFQSWYLSLAGGGGGGGHPSLQPATPGLHVPGMEGAPELGPGTPRWTLLGAEAELLLPASLGRVGWRVRGGLGWGRHAASRSRVCSACGQTCPQLPLPFILERLALRVPSRLLILTLELQINEPLMRPAATPALETRKPRYWKLVEPAFLDCRA